MMNLRTLALIAALGIGYAAPAEAVRINKVGSETTRVNFGKNASFDIYQITTEKGDTLESIAFKFEQMGIENKRICSRDYIVNPEDLLESLRNPLRTSAQQFQKVSYIFATGQGVTKQHLPEGVSFKHYIVTAIYPGFRILQ